MALLALPSDVLQSVLQASALAGDGTSLARLQCTCTLLRNALVQLDDVWKDAARVRFGSSTMSGKDAWRRGCDWLNGRCRFSLLERPDPEYARCATAPQALCPAGRFLATGSDDHQHDEDDLPEPVVIRDAHTLQVVRVISHGQALHLGYFGPPEHTLFVVYGTSADTTPNQLRICPVEGGELAPVDPSAAMPANPDSLRHFGGVCCLVGTPSRLIVSSTGSGRAPNIGQACVHVFAYDATAASYMNMRHLCTFPTVAAAVCYAPFLGVNAICSAGSGYCCVWDTVEEVATSGALKHKRRELVRFEYNQSDADEAEGEDERVGFVVASERYIVLSRNPDKRILVHSLEREETFGLDEGLENHLYYDGEIYDGENSHFVFERALAVQGEILASSSVKGVALCVWDLRLRTMLYRLENVFVYRQHLGYTRAAAGPGDTDVCGLNIVKGGAAVVAVTFGGDQYAFDFSDGDGLALGALSMAGEWSLSGEAGEACDGRISFDRARRLTAFRITTSDEYGDITVEFSPCDEYQHVEPVQCDAALMEHQPITVVEYIFTLGSITLESNLHGGGHWEHVILTLELSDTPEAFEYNGGPLSGSFSAIHSAHDDIDVVFSLRRVDSSHADPAEQPASSS